MLLPRQGIVRRTSRDDVSPLRSAKKRLVDKSLIVASAPSSSNRNSSQAHKNYTNAFVLVFVVLIAAAFGMLTMQAAAVVLLGQKRENTNPSKHNREGTAGRNIAGISMIPDGFDKLLERSVQNTEKCRSLVEQPISGIDNNSETTVQNGTVVSLPSFGITKTLQTYFFSEQQQQQKEKWPECRMPPETECDESHLSIVFMANHPDRLKGVRQKIRRKWLNPTHKFHSLVHEVIIVWNSERHIHESQAGKELLEYISQGEDAVRIVYPLERGLPENPMIRYHPNVVEPRTKALLFLDDDGPFYSFAAIQGAFELWKRHSSAQIGARAHQINLSERQKAEQFALLGVHVDTADSKTQKAKPQDDKFVSHCTNKNDTVNYNFRFHANYDANMVLPSGSILHSNYLCYLWHPAFDELRKFVLDHPVHPDDITVSMIVSHLAGAAPRVYSRQLNRPEKPIIDTQQQQRLLLSEPVVENRMSQTDELRNEALNSLVSFFGSLNSGSIGWCSTDSEYYNPEKDGRCEPTMARQGWLPWMNMDGTPKDTCP